jgi:hypothetical protein
MDQKTEPLKIVRLLQKKLGWQLDYARSGVYSDGVYGLFFSFAPIMTLLSRKMNGVELILSAIIPKKKNSLVVDAELSSRMFTKFEVNKRGLIEKR